MARRCNEDKIIDHGAVGPTDRSTASSTEGCGVTGTERVIVRDADYAERSMDLAVEGILERYPFDFRGKTVLVKPNMAAQCRIERAATTHPALIRAVVKALKRRAAKRIIVGDNPGATAYGANERCARITGIMDAAGDTYVNLAERPVGVEVNSRHVDHVYLSSEFFECDYFINLPKLKGHSHAFMTGSVKNLYGMCVGGEKSRLHVIGKNPRIFAEILVDIFQSRPPDLTIMDAVIAMEGNGPTNGTPRHVGKVLAGSNGFALDAVCARMVGYAVRRVMTLEVGRERGLWSGRIDSIPVEGEIPRIKKFKPPFTFGAYAVFGRTMSPFISCLPRIVRDKCRKCGVCASHCPVQACTFREGEFPFVDKARCIKCYCCQEFCPHDAIMLDGRMFRLTKLMARIRADDR